MSTARLSSTHENKSIKITWRGEENWTLNWSPSPEIIRKLKKSRSSENWHARVRPPSWWPSGIRIRIPMLRFDEIFQPEIDEMEIKIGYLIWTTRQSSWGGDGQKEIEESLFQNLKPNFKTSGNFESSSTFGHLYYEHELNPEDQNSRGAYSSVTG